MSNILSHVNYDGKAIDIIDATSKPINVLTLGIKNDGITDCTALINKYTADFPLFFPSGKYLISDTINVVHSLIGVGYSRNSNSDGTVFFSNSNNNIFLFNLGDSVVGNITLENIGIHCNANNNGINITTKKYIKLSNIGIFAFGNIGDGPFSGTKGYRYGLKAGNETLGQSRSIYITNISILSNPNSPTYGIYTTNIYDADITNIEVMFCRHSVSFNSSFITMSRAHLWCGTTDYSSLTKDEFSSTRAISLNNTKFRGTDIYTDTAAINFNLNNAQAYITNYCNWFDTSLPYDGNCDMVYQDNPSTLKITNGLIYIPAKFYKDSWLWKASQTCLSNISYTVDANPTQYWIKKPSSFDSRFLVLGTANKYSAFLICKPFQHYGEYIQVRCLLNDKNLIDIYIKNDSKTLRCDSITTDSVPVYYKVSDGCIVFYAQLTIAEGTIITASHNCLIYKLSEFLNTDNSPYSITQDDNNGLTLLEKNKDITIG